MAATHHLIHDFSYRRVRERDLFDSQGWLEVPVRRVRCADCGPRREHIDWLPGRLALTRTMVNRVEPLVRLMPVKHVSALLNLHWHTIKAIDQRRLAREVTEPGLTNVRRANHGRIRALQGA